MDHSGNKHINLNAGPGVAVREYSTDVAPTDYVLFVDGKPVGVIEAKREDEGYKLSLHEDQAESEATAKWRYLNNQKLPLACSWFRSDADKYITKNITKGGGLLTIRVLDQSKWIILWRLYCIYEIFRSIYALSTSSHF